MNRSETIGKLALALSKAQAEIEGASKDSRNPHFNSNYADLASIVDASRPALSKHELSVAQFPSADGNLVRMVTLLMHSSGEWLQSEELQVQAKDAGPQSVGSCLTYLRRFQLAAMVGVAPKDDDDGNAGQEAQKAQTTKPMPEAWKPHVKPAPKTAKPPEPPPLSDKDIPF